MTFVKEAALACLAVLNGFTKTKAISNKTDRPAKKALANFTVCGNCDRPSHAQFHAWSFNPHCIHGLLGSRALAEVVSGKRREPSDPLVPQGCHCHQKCDRTGLPRTACGCDRPAKQSAISSATGYSRSQPKAALGQGRDSINPFYEDRIRIREQSWRTWDR